MSFVYGFIAGMAVCWIAEKVSRTADHPFGSGSDEVNL